MNPIQDTPGYRMISEFYGDRRAERSQVPLINHIHEGIEILRRIGADTTTIEAFAAHPVFQPDPDLKNNWHLAKHLSSEVTMLVMEYRNIANGYLSDKIKTRRIRGWGDPIEPGDLEAYRDQDIKLSPIPAVNQMLIADKVQNRKDFIAYHFGTHARSVELDYYFKYWLEVLNVSEEMYEGLVRDL